MYRGYTDREIARQKSRVAYEVYQDNYYRGGCRVNTVSKANKWLKDSTGGNCYKIGRKTIYGLEKYVLLDSCGNIGAQGFTLDECIVNSCRVLGLKVPSL